MGSHDRLVSRPTIDCRWSILSQRTERATRSRKREKFEEVNSKLTKTCTSTWHRRTATSVEPRCDLSSPSPFPVKNVTLAHFSKRERERNKKTAAMSSKRYNVPYVKCCPSIAALWIFHLCGTSFTLHPGTERQLNSSCILATALLWGNGSRGTGGRVWSGYCWKRTAVFVFPSSPNKASFSRSLLTEKRNSRRICTVSFVSRSFWPRPLLLVPCWLLFWETGNLWNLIALFCSPFDVDVIHKAR